MPIRVEVALRETVTDTQGNKTAHKIKSELGLSVDQVRIIRIYTIEGLNAAQVDAAIAADDVAVLVLRAQERPRDDGDEGKTRGEGPCRLAFVFGFHGIFPVCGPRRIAVAGSSGRCRRGAARVTVMTL